MTQSQTPATPIQQPRIEKVVVNICTGKSGEPLQRAMVVLEQLTGHKACQRKARRTIRDWGVRKGEPIACIVTLRGEDALAFLKRAFDAVGNRFHRSSFDSLGNFAFGISEHIQLPGVKYDPAIGIYGMDVCVSVEKPGYRVKKRRHLKARIGKAQRITPDGSMNYIKELFGIEIED